MSARVREIIKGAVQGVADDGVLKKIKEVPEVLVEKPKKEGFGDFSTNVAMLIAPIEGRPPREIAAAVSQRVSEAPEVERCEVAGPGFINIFMRKSYWISVLEGILGKGSEYGGLDIGAGKKVQVEFVSANPTGPLHIGHGRGAAVGDSLANI